MARAKRHSNSHWWVCMMQCAKEVAERKPYLYTDDIVQLCRMRHPNASTHEPRAIGPLMRDCCKLGYFERTQDHVESTQAQNHRRPIRVWHSLLYNQPHPALRKHRINDPREYAVIFDEASLAKVEQLRRRRLAK
jgi:hypothetical protein